MPLIERARVQLPAVVVDHLPADSDEIRAAVIAWLREHAAQLQVAGKHAVRMVVQLLIGIVLGAMLALHRTRSHAPGGPLTQLLNARCANVVTAFHDVVFAQLKISAVNTLLIAAPIYYACLKRELETAHLI